jgi:hypothetical protein
MPTFKKSEHILTGFGEFFDPNWMDSDTIVLPPKIEWDYQREMRFEDVYIWEQLCEPFEYGVYAAWDPYAEFFVLRKELEYEKVAWDVNHVRKFEFETFYGQGAQQALMKRMAELNIIRYVKLNQIWVDPEKMWLYS